MAVGDEDKFKHVATYAGLPRTTRGRTLNVHKWDDKLLYCNGNAVFIRNIKVPLECEIYTEHQKETTVAACSPSGFYICSADELGNVRIWDTTQKEHILKYSYQLISGAVLDICWSDDSKRIAVCGIGRDTFATVINWDTGTKCGSLTGMTKSCNSISYRQVRPYRLIVGSEDYSVQYYAGPPFKSTLVHNDHTNFVNCVRYAPDGSKFVTTGADMKAHIYDGKTGEKQGMLNESAGKIHQGGVYGLAWSSDCKFLTTVSADKTVKVWAFDREDFKEIKEKVCWTVGKTTDDMQVGCVWFGGASDPIVSISLSGFINVFRLDEKKPTVIKGHNKAIICSCVHRKDGVVTLFTASYDARICFWDKDGLAEVVSTEDGPAHTNQVTRMFCHGDRIVTCSMDDTVKFIDISYSPEMKKVINAKYLNASLKLPSQPQDVCLDKTGVALVACLNEIVAVYLLEDVYTLHIAYKRSSGDYNYTTLDCHPSSSLVAVGCSDAIVRLFTLDGHELKEKGSEKLRQAQFPTHEGVVDVRFSTDGRSIGCCTKSKQTKVVSTADIEQESCNFAAHATKVNSIAWSPNSCYLASSGVDGAVKVYDVTQAKRTIDIRGAHANNVDVTSVQWASNSSIITTGRQDCSVRVFEVLH